MASRGSHQAILNSTGETFGGIWFVKVPWELSEKAINVLPPNPPPPQLEDKMAIIIMAHFMFNGTCSLGTKWTNKKVSFPSIVNDECLTYFKTLSLGWAHCHAARPDLPIMMACLSHQRILRIVASAVQTHGTSFTAFWIPHCESDGRI